MGKVTRFLGATVAMVLVLAVGLGACGLPLTAPAPTHTPLPPTNTPVPLVATSDSTPIPVAEPPPPSPQAILENSLKALQGVDSWHLEIEAQVTANANNLSLNIPVAYSGNFYAPESLEGTLSIQFFGLTMRKDTVLIARTVEATNPGAPGATASVKPATVFSVMQFAGLEPADVKDLQLVGKETLDGTPVYHLKGKVTAEELEAVQRDLALKLTGEVTFEAWIGVDDYLPRRGAVEGAIAGALSPQGSVHVVGTATFSKFGQPMAVEAVEFTVPAAGKGCAAADKGFVPYRDDSEAISFCHPADWPVNDIVDVCGFYVTSPTGLGPRAPMPPCLTLIYPHRTAARFGDSAAGAVEVSARTSFCFLKFVGDAVMKDGVGSLTGGFLGNDPVVAILTGIKYGDARAAALSCMMDEVTYRSTVEAIMYSIAPGIPTRR